MEQPRLIIISGLPGSGKSTLAEGIARSLKIPVFSVDPIESSILKGGFKKSFKTGLTAYLVVETLASEQLKLGLSVVIDAVSHVKESRDMWRGLKNKFKAKLIIIECVLNKEIHKERIGSRIRNMYGIPEVTWDDVEKRRREYLKWEEERLIIETSNEREINLEKALKYITQKTEEN